MITPKEAYIRFKAEHRDLEVKEACLYKNSMYVFVASNIKGDIDYNSPYYAIDAKTGRAKPFNPLTDLFAFQDAIINHKVDWR